MKKKWKNSERSNRVLVEYEKTGKLPKMLVADLYETRLKVEELDKRTHFLVEKTQEELSEVLAPLRSATGLELEWTIELGSAKHHIKVKGATIDDVSRLAKEFQT